MCSQLHNISIAKTLRYCNHLASLFSNKDISLCKKKEKGSFQDFLIRHWDSIILTTAAWCLSLGPADLPGPLAVVWISVGSCYQGLTLLQHCYLTLLKSLPPHWATSKPKLNPVKLSLAAPCWLSNCFYGSKSLAKQSTRIWPPTDFMCFQTWLPRNSNSVFPLVLNFLCIW